MGDAVSGRPRRKHKVGPTFCNVLLGASGGIGTDKLRSMIFVKLSQQTCVAAAALRGIYFSPLVHQPGPERIVEPI